jgi:hypothetical protein
MSLGGGDFGEDPAVRPPAHFRPTDYLEMGRLLCEAVLDMYDPGRARLDGATAPSPPASRPPPPSLSLERV